MLTQTFSLYFAEMSAPPCCSAGLPIPITNSGPCSVPASIATSRPPPPQPLPSSEQPKSLPPSLLQRGGGGGQLIGGSNGGSVESAFLETRAALKETKRKNREQARKARQLVTAVAAKIEEKDEEMERVCR